MSTAVEQYYNLEDAIAEIVRRYDSKPTALIMILQDIQNHYRYLPRPALDIVAEQMGLPLAQIFGVATFYKTFSMKPKGNHHICVCTGTACHVRQANIILDRLQHDLGVSAGETTDDGQFSYETVNCLGACALGPLVTVDEEFFGDMTVARLNKLITGLRQQKEGEASS